MNAIVRALLPLWQPLILGISIFSLLLSTGCAAAPKFEYEIFTGEAKAVLPNSILIKGKKEAVLVDAQWLLSDGAKVVDMVEKSGLRLTHILITHGHPDHYWGLAPLVERFPEAKVLARQPVVDEISYQFSAKWLHWQLLFGDEIPVKPVIPEVFEGDSIELEGHKITFIDLPPAETMDATAFYVSVDKTLIAGDLIFAKTHAYFSDLGNPGGWIKALELVKRHGPIEQVIPGHGPVGGIELIDEQIRYMQDYQSIAQPGVTIQEIAPKVIARYPDHELPVFLWWTRGPGLGPLGPRALGVPKELLQGLPETY